MAAAAVLTAALLLPVHPHTGAELPLPPMRNPPICRRRKNWSKASELPLHRTPLATTASGTSTVDLSADAGGYVFAPRTTGVANPLWDLTIVERTSAVGTEPPYLIDSRMLGVLYLGRLKFEVDPFTGFKANLITLRVESKAPVSHQKHQGRSPNRAT